MVIQNKIKKQNKKRIFKKKKKVIPINYYHIAVARVMWYQIKDAYGTIDK